MLVDAKQFVPLCEEDEQPLASKTAPLVAGLTAWSNRSIKLCIDADGNCYASSWMLGVVLYSVQEEGRIRLLEQRISRLLTRALWLIPEKHKVRRLLLQKQLLLLV